ncbi:hypothetical protein HPT25_26385 [Bacillus sp. BRMEA1]|nr:hypothetical protein [Neobacillus endophyticus]NRD80860.1 hypothetical protein [Neobacillus endophyticus]
MKKKRDEEDMTVLAIKKQSQSTDRKKRIQASYEKAVKQNGKALERLSKN